MLSSYCKKERKEPLKLTVLSSGSTNPVFLMVGISLKVKSSKKTYLVQVLATVVIVVGPISISQLVSSPVH